MSAKPWDGVGPERECLVRLHYGGGGRRWLHVDWAKEQYVEPISRAAKAFKTNRGRYECVGVFRITHWAELPEVAP